MYIYGMKERGCSPGAQPKDGFDGYIESYDPRYYDLIYYKRMLTEEEISEYELEYLGEGDI